MASVTWGRFQLSRESTCLHQRSDSSKEAHSRAVSSAFQAHLVPSLCPGSLMVPCSFCRGGTWGRGCVPAKESVRWTSAWAHEPRVVMRVLLPQPPGPEGGLGPATGLQTAELAWGTELWECFHRSQAFPHEKDLAGSTQKGLTCLVPEGRGSTALQAGPGSIHSCPEVCGWEACSPPRSQLITTQGNEWGLITELNGAKQSLIWHVNRKKMQFRASHE